MRAMPLICTVGFSPCVGIKYLHDEQRACVYFDSPQPDLRILRRDGDIRFYR